MQIPTSHTRLLSLRPPRGLLVTTLLWLCVLVSCVHLLAALATLTPLPSTLPAGMCNKMLDSTNSNCHENVLYCKTCHGRKFGPKGYGFGGGAAGLSMDTGSQFEE